MDLNYVKATDLEIYEAISKETSRQEEKIELIASENFTSEAVREAMGSTLDVYKRQDIFLQWLIIWHQDQSFILHILLISLRSARELFSVFLNISQ